jgi:hypothetical protein
MDDPRSWRVVISIQCEYGFDVTYRGCPGDTMEEAVDYALEVMADLVPKATALRAWAVKEDCIPPEVKLQRVKKAAFQREGAK